MTKLTPKCAVFMGIKFFLLAAVFMVFLSVFSTSFVHKIERSIQTAAVFIILSSTYFAFFATKKEREKILGMWKLYIPMLVFMSVYFNSTNTYLLGLIVESKKAQIQYEIASENFADANVTLHSLHKIVSDHLEVFMPADPYPLDKEIKTDDNFTVTEQMLFHGNIAFNTMTTISLGMLLWFIIELGFFRECTPKKRQWAQKVFRKSDFLKVKKR